MKKKIVSIFGFLILLILASQTGVSAEIGPGCYSATRETSQYKECALKVDGKNKICGFDSVTQGEICCYDNVCPTNLTQGSTPNPTPQLSSQVNAGCYKSNSQDYVKCTQDSKSQICGQEDTTAFRVCCKGVECPSNTTQGKVERQASGITCITNNGTGTGIKTAIGCVPFNNVNDFVSFILRWALGVAGGIAFLLILFAGFQIMTSRGDPNRLKAGQELLTSAIAGLLLLIFSIFILRVIGVNILNIQGFGSGQ